MSPFARARSRAYTRMARWSRASRTRGLFLDGEAQVGQKESAQEVVLIINRRKNPQKDAIFRLVSCSRVYTQIRLCWIIVLKSGKNISKVKQKILYSSKSYNPEVAHKLYNENTFKVIKVNTTRVGAHVSESFSSV